MRHGPRDELQAKRIDREQARIANLLSTIDDRPTMTEQETALERARETWALSRPDVDRDRTC